MQRHETRATNARIAMKWHVLPAITNRCQMPWDGSTCSRSEKEDRTKRVAQSADQHPPKRGHRHQRHQHGTDTTGIQPNAMQGQIAADSIRCANTTFEKKPHSATAQIAPNKSHHGVVRK